MVSTEREEIHVKGKCTMTISWIDENKHDEDLISKIRDLIYMEQDLCSNCVNVRTGGTFCGYAETYCDIHGSIEYPDHPHHDGDGTKCEDYRRKERKWPD